MKPTLHPKPLPALAALSLALALGGCASKEELEARRKWETYDERADREVFRSNWLMPSVSEEDKRFFYRPFFKSSNNE